MLKIAKRKEARLLAALAAGGLVLSPAFATTTAKKRAPAVAVSFDPISSFTPANADPKLAAALAGKGLALTDFKFTPAPRRAVRHRFGSPSARAPPAHCRRSLPISNAPATAISALAPTSYNLGVALGWKRFAISGDVAGSRTRIRRLAAARAQIVGVSYSLKRFTGRVAVGAERSDGHPLPALRKGDNYSLDVGGSYSLSQQIALTGGVRYNVERDRMSALQDVRRDSQAVYVGTAFKF